MASINNTSTSLTTISGTYNADIITGDSDAETINGGDGDDKLHGGIRMTPCQEETETIR